MACWLRSREEEPPPNESFLTQQLKFAREQIDKKSRLNDQLSGELRRLQAELEVRSTAARDARELVGASAAELRAAAHAHEVERSELLGEVYELQSELETLNASQARATAMGSTASALAEPREPATEANEVGGTSLSMKVSTLEPDDTDASATTSAAEASSEAAVAAAATARIAELETEMRAAAAAAAARVAELESEIQALQAAVTAAAEREAAVVTERARLQAALTAEKELHKEAMRLVEAQRAESQEKACEMRQELRDLSATLAQKEEDILNIQFEMAALTNRLGDQTLLTYENADAFQAAAEELADKDEKLENAQQKQEELLAQMRELSDKLEGKVAKLTNELESSRSALQTSEAESKSTVARLEADRDALTTELERVRSEAGAELANLRAELQRREAAASERRAALELELSTLKASAERTTRDLESNLLREEATAKRARDAAEAELIEEMKSIGEGMIASGSAAVAEGNSPRSPMSPRTPRSPRKTARRRHREECKAVFQWFEAAVTQVQSQRIWSLEESLAACTEKLAAMQAQNGDLQTALDLSKLLEQQAKEQAQERMVDLRALRALQFEAAAPREDTRTSIGSVEAPQRQISSPKTKPPQVLISVDLDLGSGRVAKLKIAPWHTKSDFHKVVREFLEEHRVRTIFADSIVKYLDEVEREASVFPVTTVASLTELYSRYG